MFKPLIVYIGLRYTRPKKKDQFVSFISVASVLGIIIGVATLICVLSVMNGFDYQIRSKIFHLTPHILLTAPNEHLSHWSELSQRIQHTPHVVGVAPYIQGYAMIRRGQTVHPIMINGVDPHLQKNVSQLPEQMTSGSFSQLEPGQFNIVIGQSLALQLGLGIDSVVNVFTPNLTVTPLGVWPQVKPFKIAGIYQASGRAGLDDSMAFINLQDAKALYQMADTVTGLRLSVDDLYIAPSVAKQLQHEFKWKYVITDWTQRYQAFFKAIAMEKTMMFLILLLIVAVAVFNLVSTMVMIVNDKRADIAILRTIGASPRTILLTFIVQGSVVGVLGTALGALGGVLLAQHVNLILSGLQRLLGTQLIAPSIYFIDFLPSQIHVHDIILVCSLTLFMCLLATLYPSWRASKITPAEALRYE